VHADLLLLHSSLSLTYTVFTVQFPYCIFFSLTVRGPLRVMVSLNGVEKEEEEEAA